MSACATCAGRCSVEVKAAYARAALKALVADQGYPDCDDFQEKSWIDGGEMMGQMERIKKLPGAAAMPAPFDAARAYAMAERVYERINAFYRPGALEWARTAAVDLFARQDRAGLRVDVAFKAEDMEQIKATLGEFGAAMRAICVRFEESGEALSVGSSPCAQKCTMSIRHDYNFNILDLKTQEIDAEGSAESARMNPLATSDSDRRLQGPSNSQQPHVQGCALGKNPAAARNENLNFHANGHGAPWF